MNRTTAWRVAVPVATGWTSPAAPRDIDAQAVADQPDVEAWLASLVPETRLGLHGRTLTQLLEGEPVAVIEESGDWVRVMAGWQPEQGSPGGYRCWVRRAHLRPATPGDLAAPVAQVPATRAAVLAEAFQHVGLPYLWGGTSPAGLDCSGLVHWSHRRAGVVVPRDAGDQARATEFVARGDEVAGDLYFFGEGMEHITHVGFVTAVGEMLHSPEDAEVPGGGTIVHEPLTERLRSTLVHVGRVLQA